MTLSGPERRQLETMYPTLRRFAAVVAPPDVEPDDLVQDAMVGALRRRSLEDYDDPVAYLRRSIVSLATSHRRRWSIRQRVLGRVGPVDEVVEMHHTSDLADLLRLTPSLRAVLFLSDVEGFTLEEVAAQLGCSPEAARARASRGRRQLRRELEEEMS